MNISERNADLLLSSKEREVPNIISPVRATEGDAGTIFRTEELGFLFLTGEDGAEAEKTVKI